MLSKLKIIVKDLILIGLFLIIGAKLYDLKACSCDPIPFEKAVERADEIFVGKIVRAEKVDYGSIMTKDGRKLIETGWKYDFEVQRKWKGSKKSNLILYQLGTSCDYWFNVYEKEYLVYASRKLLNDNSLSGIIAKRIGKKQLATWLCARTTANQPAKKHNWFKEDIAKLNKQFPTKVQISKFQLNSFYWILLLGVALLIAYMKITKK
jgi:hypothetical protein